MVNVATTGDTAINDEFMPIPIPEGASIEEQLAIIMANIERHKEKRARDMASLIAKTKQRFRDWDQQIEQNAREAREQFHKPFLSSDKQTTQHAANITSEFTTLREEGSSLANSQQGELERQKPAREEVVSETNLPIGGNQPKGLTGESQPYTEAVHGKGHQQDCSSDNTIVSEQISDFSTDQAKYVATDQMHGGQDMTHDHPFDQEKLATVGDKADLGTPSSPKLQLKIMPRQPTKILGGQDYPSHEPNSSKFFNEKYLCSFPTSSHRRDFYPTNFDTSELGMKHRWPPPWSSRG